MAQRKSETRDTFSGVEIELLGGNENLDEGESITGSCTLFQAQDTQGNKVSVVIDMGTHQSGEKSQKLNEYVDPRIVSADYLIITHLHIDHIGRLPMLIKAGFIGKIYMTNYTRSLGEASLIDSAKLMLREYELTDAQNKKKRDTYNRALKHMNIESTIAQNNLKPGKKEKLKAELETIERKFGGQILKDTIGKIKDYQIDSPSRIEEILKPQRKPLYSVEDVEALFSGNYIHIIEPGSFTHLELSGHKGARDVQNKPIIQDVVLTALDAAHTIGSVQFDISIRTRSILSGTEKINGGEEEIKEESFLFSGDLGRTDAGNFAGKLEMPSKNQYRYAQVESTYADRNHPERETSIKEFFEVLHHAEQTVVIPAFSIQRTQDILLLLLRYYDEVVVPKKQELRKKMKELKTDFNESSQSIEETELYNTVREKFNKEFEKLDFKVYTDSALGAKATKVYAYAYGREYAALRDEEQVEKYGEVLIHQLQPHETQMIANERVDHSADGITKKKVKKEIFVSSGGMCEGGPIIPHLARNVSNANSTIIFMGYTPPNTLGGKIKTDDIVLIEGVAHKVYADIHDIAGFSGHAGEVTLLEYTSHFNDACIVALTHGGDKRYKMRDKMRKKKRGEILIPQNGDKIRIAFEHGKKPSNPTPAIHAKVSGQSI